MMKNYKRESEAIAKKLGGTIDGRTLANIQTKHPAPDPMAIYRTTETRSPGPAGQLRSQGGKSAMERLREAVERQDNENPTSMDGGPDSMDGPSL